MQDASPSDWHLRFCHAILTRFSEGLAAGGHTNEVVDLHAIGFNPVLTERDGPDWIDDSVPLHVKESMLEARGNPLRRLMVKRWMSGKDDLDVLRAIHARGAPRDVKIQQEKVAAADALAFIAPIYFVGFPAILKGWIERVFTLGFAFALKPEAWRGDLRGRVPLLEHEKALVMTTTIFDERSYREELGPAMKTLIDDFALHYPGIRRVEHEYFYAVYGADDETRRAYLDRAYALGRDFAASVPKGQFITGAQSSTGPASLPDAASTPSTVAPAAIHSRTVETASEGRRTSGGIEAPHGGEPDIVK